MDGQKDKTLYEALKDYADCGRAPFHMPGHKRNMRFEHLFGAQRYDITEIDGFDNLHGASGLIAASEKKAAELFGVRHARLLVGGSSAGILAAVRTLASEGDKALVARNVHRSVLSAIELFGIEPYYILPKEEDGFFGVVDPESVRDAIAAHPDAKLLVLVSPTYEGVISDVRTIAEICRGAGVKLLLDEAHGAHLGLCDAFGGSGRAYADITVCSLHKTLPALTQSALLFAGEGADMCRLDESLAMLQTSSPSYVLMASMDGLFEYLQKGGIAELEAFGTQIAALRERLRNLKHIRLFTPSDAYDISKLTLFAGDMGGVKLAKALRERFDIEVEMAGEGYAVLMCTVGDEPCMYEALERALVELDAECGPKTYVNACPPLPKKALNPKQADGKVAQALPINECKGRISLANVYAYPPGSPIAVKGEILGAQTLEYIRSLMAAGVEVCGVDDKGRIEVVKQRLGA